MSLFEEFIICCREFGLKEYGKIEEWETLEDVELTGGYDCYLELVEENLKGGSDYTEFLKEKGISYEHKHTDAGLDKSNEIYAIEKNGTITFVNFIGIYDSYQSIHHYEKMVEVTPRSKTITVWE